MAITAAAYANAYKGFGMGRFDFTSQTLKLALLTSSYTPNYATHEFYSDLTNEVVGAGYTAGGNAIPSLTWVYTSGVGATLNGGPVAWSGASVSCRYAVIYRTDPAPTAAPLLLAVDFGTTVNTNGAPFPVTFSFGIFKLTD